MQSVSMVEDSEGSQQTFIVLSDRSQFFVPRAVETL